MYLTKRQKEILDYVRDHVGEHGYAPTLQEIGVRFGLSSPATVYKHVEQLVQKGYVTAVPEAQRRSRITIKKVVSINEVD